LKVRLVPILPGGRVESDVTLVPAAQEILQATDGLYQQVGFALPWICYIAFLDDVAVGTCGFKSAPSQGRVELAYYTFPGNEGRGVATAMAAELVAMANRTDPAVTVAAQTLPERNASHRVLEKQGFSCVGPVEHPEDGLVLEWQKTRPVADPLKQGVS
jgi:RimJ/RimL family protein N-acetyltransferase